MAEKFVDPRIGFENGFRAFFQGCNVCNDKTLGWTKIFHSGEARPADPHFVAGWQAARDLPGWYGEAEVYELADLAVREAQEEVVRIREEEILALSLDLPFEEREKIRAVRHWREDALARATAQRHRLVNARARVDHALRALRAEAESVSRELSEVGS